MAHLPVSPMTYLYHQIVPYFRIRLTSGFVFSNLS